MVVEIQITDPNNECHILRNNTDTQLNNNNNTNDKNTRFGKEKLEAIKTTLLNANEVTFCNLSDDDHGDEDGDHRVMSQLTVVSPTRRKQRLNSELSEADSILSSSFNEPLRKPKPKIPDGGFGWVVVFSSLMVSLIMDGVSFSFGLIYTELLAYFGESKSKTAWVGSLFIAVPLLSGPIMSNLVDRYGCRKCTMIGGAVASLGFVLASYCTSIEQLYFTFGILAGVGLGVGYVTVVVSVAFWFDKKRTFATGIGASGTGIGTFLYAPFTQYLIENFGWRGTTLILAGTLFNICVMGALMRDPDWMIEENKLESRSQSIQTFSNSSVCLDEIKKLLENGVPKEHLLDTLVTNVNTEANQTIPPEDQARVKKYQSEITLPTFINDHDIVHPMSGSRRSLRQAILANNSFRRLEEEPSPVDESKTLQAKLASSESLNTNEKVSSAGCGENESLGLKASLETLSAASLDEGYLSCQRQKELQSRGGGSTWSLDETCRAVKNHQDDESNQRSFRGTSLDVVYENEIFNPNVNTTVTLVVPKQETIKPRGRKGGLKRANLHNHSMRYSHFLKDMRVHRNSIHYRGALLNAPRYRLKASSCPNIYRNSMTTIAREKDEKWYDDFIDALKTMFDFSLFLEFKFSMIMASTLMLFIWYIIPYFYIPDYMLMHGFTEQDGANMISIVGITNTIGMIVLGWLGDQSWVNVTKTYMLCMFLCGISIALMPLLVVNYTTMAILCGLFGFTFASTFSFTPIILVQLVSLDDFTVAYGLCLLVQGIGSLVGPPMAGFMYDLTESWAPSFYAAGFFIFTSGLFAWLVDPLDGKEKESEEMSSTVTE